MQSLLKILTKKTTLNEQQVKNIITLLEDGSTIPFIARYRKEMTSNASDEELRFFGDVYESVKRLEERKREVLRLIEEKGELNDKIKTLLDEAETISRVEDIYRPFKEQKNSRYTIALKNGLDPLAKILASGKLSLSEFKNEAKKFVKDGLSLDEVIKGSCDIVAQRYSDDIKEREILRNTLFKSGILEVKATKKFEDNGVFKNYKEHSERVAYIPSHRFLAINRGVKEKQLSMKISIDTDRIYENIQRYKIPKYASSSKELLFDAYKDGFKRLLFPSIEREILSEVKIASDASAIEVFGKNLSQLLMTPPMIDMVILGVDPAFRTGCKLAVIDKHGNYLDHTVIYPTPPQNRFDESKKEILRLVKKYNISGIAIGNGTASKETQEFFSKINETLDKPLKYTIVSEAGASVYSASKIASEEYPDLDVTIRGAISIAQRLRDPMAALVKIDPKSLGIGQYQHDVDQKLLEKKLHEGIEDVVNRVGVEVNSASFSLLSYVAGVGKRVAKNIVEYRDQNGEFRAKSDLKRVKGLGAKAYEQCAGFMRIRDGKSLLDNTGVHPESYSSATMLIKNHDISSLKLSDASSFSDELKIGEETLKDIIKELQKPGFDPREDLPKIPFQDNLRDISSLKEGSIVSGVVRNIADFGAFVDIGLKNDGLIHISQMSQKRISHPLEVVSINQYLPSIKVLSVDVEKGKTSLSLKEVL
jgi:uncharacterized protein